MLLRYDSNRIIAYGTCDSSYDSSTSSHHDYRPNYCPTRTVVQVSIHIRKFTWTWPLFMFYLTDDKETVAYFNTWFQSDLIFPFLFLFINFDVWLWIVQEGNVPAVNNVIDWSSGVTVFSNKAFALQYTTTASKTLECFFYV
jgi:hypothetical protein